MLALICPVCKSEETEQSIRRIDIPVHQHLLFDTPTEARSIMRGDLDFAVCHRCGFGWNAAFEMSRLNYGAEYENTQNHSPAFQEYLDGLVHHLVQDCDVRDKRIVEVGCGKGYFLEQLVKNPVWNNTAMGFDPSYLGEETCYDGRLRFIREFYGPAFSEVAADVVVSRHVIEHVEDPVGLLKSIRAALVHSPNAKIYFETPCLRWILENRVIWDFFYEHCSYFTASSLKTAFEAAGFRVSKVRHIFEGQYLWLEASVAEEPVPPTYHTENIPALAIAFATAETGIKELWGRKITRLRQRGPVAIWGAGAKGVTFAGLVDPDGTRVDCVVDLNPNKHGRYLPGTGHPIVDYRDLPGRGVQTAILMNPNYRRENETLLTQAEIQLELLEDSLVESV